VRLGAVRAGGDDGVERKALCAQLVEEGLDPPGELAFRTADELLLGEPLVDPGRDSGRRSNRAQLRLVLDRAQALHKAAAGDQVSVARGQGFPRGVGGRARLEADRAREEAREVGVEIALEQLDLDAVHGPRALGVAKVGEEADALGLDQECRVRADEAGQVTDVRGRADEERLLELLPQPFDTVVHRPSARKRSASR
jgi:hypothetical protein